MFSSIHMYKLQSFSYVTILYTRRTYSVYYKNIGTWKSFQIGFIIVVPIIV